MYLINEIEAIYKKNSIGFMLDNYVDKHYHDNAIKAMFKNKYFENVTDFNYSKCISICINLSDTDATVGNENFTEFLEKNLNLYRLEFQLSLLAPYAMRKYLKYELRNNQQEMSSSDIPHLKEHMSYEIIVQQFFKEIKYTLLDDNDLTLEVPNITLELREGTPSVYNCLFEDMSSFYPY